MVYSVGLDSWLTYAVFLISLGLEGAGVGDVHGLPGDHHDAVGVPLVYHFSVDLRMK